MLTATAEATWALSCNTAAGDIWTDTRDTEIGASIRARGQWAEGECAFIKSVLQPGDTVIDVGANIGFISRFCSQLVGESGIVIAIEPEPRNRELLERNAAEDPCQAITVLPVAVGSSRGEIDIWQHPSGNFGGARSIPFAEGNSLCTTVECWPLDELLMVRPVHFVKIDAEGMDHDVVFGMEQIYREFRPKVLAEFNVAAMTAMGLNAGDVLREYRARGFHPRILTTDAQLMTTCLGVEMGAMLGPSLLVNGQENEVAELVSRVGSINLVM